LSILPRPEFCLSARTTVPSLAPPDASLSATSWVEDTAPYSLTSQESVTVLASLRLNYKYCDCRFARRGHSFLLPLGLRRMYARTNPEEARGDESGGGGGRREGEDWGGAQEGEADGEGAERRARSTRHVSGSGQARDTGT